MARAEAAAAPSPLLDAEIEALVAQARADADELRRQAMREAESIRRQALTTAEGIRHIAQEDARELRNRAEDEPVRAHELHERLMAWDATLVPPRW